MKEKRIELYQKRGEFLLSDQTEYDDFIKNNPKFEVWEKKSFQDLDWAIKVLNTYNNEGMFDPKLRLSEFISTYACDLDWAKQTEYCKVEPQKPKQGYTKLENQSEKTSLFSKFPCLLNYPLYLYIDNDGMEQKMIIVSMADEQAIYYPNGYYQVFQSGKKLEDGTFKCPEQ